MSACERYRALSIDREPFLLRARKASEVTIRSLVPPDGHTAADDMLQPWQSFGARCVNNLSSSLLLSLLPPTRRPFRLRLQSKFRAMIPDDQYGEWELALARYEQRVSEDIEITGTRVQVAEALKHLIVAGTVALYYGPTATRVFPLHQFVCRRDPEGGLAELVVLEKILEDQIPEEIRPMVVAKRQAKQQSVSHVASYELYTTVTRDGEIYKSIQTIEDIPVPGSDGNWPAEDLPWSVPRWIRIDGEDYGRGHVEDHYGDFKSLEALTRDIVRASAMASKVVFLVKGGMTDRDDLADAQSGDCIPGDKDDVGVVTLEKFADFRITQEVIADLKQSLAAAFLLNSALRRDAERVTAEEIRMLIQELENALGGVWSTMTVELLLPLIRSRMATMQRNKKVPKLPDKAVEPMVVTGVESLGRADEQNRLDRYVQRLSAAFGPQALPSILDVAEYARRAAAADDIEPKGLVKTSEQREAEQNQANQMALAQQAVTPVAKVAAEQFAGANQPQ